MNQLIFHSRVTEGNKARVTVAAILDGQVARFGVSRCSENDQFVKKVGAQRAIGRAKSSKPFATQPVPKEGLCKWFTSFAKEVADKVVEEPRLV